MRSERERQLRKTFTDKRSNAKRAGFEFTIEFEDLVFPDHCPVFGMELNYARGRGLNPDSASYDRVNPDLHYVKGNVIIVSHLANTMKSNGSVEQMQKLYEFYRDLKVQHYTGVLNENTDSGYRRQRAATRTKDHLVHWYLQRGVWCLHQLWPY